MTRADLWKLVLVVVAVAAATYTLLPSFQFYQLGRAERVHAEVGSSAADLRDRAIPLGLDLQGGMHLVLELDRTELAQGETADAMDRTLLVLRNRIDGLGIAEPVIQKQGEDRIVIQLPGVQDPSRVKDLLGETALLEFKLVRLPEEAQQAFASFDVFLSSRASLGVIDVDTTVAAAPFSSNFADAIGGSVFIPEVNLGRVERYVATYADSVSGLTGTSLTFGEVEEHPQYGRGRWLYPLREQAELTGGSVQTATPDLDTSGQGTGGWMVRLQLTPDAGSRFAQITQANVGRQLAIVLDNRVQSAPRINERIPRGEAQITGNFTTEEAKDLSVVLEAGSLPTAVNIIEERTVGPSLGQDSIEAGAQAALVGTALVILFMLVYYQASGGVAVLALVLNLYLLFALLAAFGATLTLPGIAGIVLTVGMAVDANVLILERIREELRAGKTVRAAINMGYDRAFRTILDANVTTLISAAFLFQFGTGPIRGFAITLSIGLIVNMFTAVLFTRLIYDWITHRRSLQKLSI